MDFRELTYISAIAKHQSISRAAAALYISQPSLSKFLQNTEHTLGLKLFDRRGRKYILTYAGERYLSYAQKILSLKDSMNSEMNDISNQKQETLRIGFSSLRGSDFILEVIPRFSALYPNIQLQLQEVNYNNFETALLGGDLDIVLINLPIKNPAIEYQILAHDEILLVAPEEHPINHMAEQRDVCNYPWIDLRWLQSEHFIMPVKQLRMYTIIEDLFIQAQFTPNVLFYTQNLETAAILASEGYGLTFTNLKYISHTNFRHAPKLFSLGSPSTYRTFVAAWRKNTVLSAGARAIINLAKNE
ncbi:MAG: LysR family transcriptional regulator [Clostridia bacterium]|nr:LysR family transcriptional regulator [Clostridia bacterium]